MPLQGVGLKLFSPGSIITPSAINMTVPLSTTDAITVKVSGDTQQRLIVNGDGTLEWGSGSAASDVTFSRSASGVMEQKSGSTPQTLRIYSGATAYAAYTGTGVDLQAAGSYTFGANITSIPFSGPLLGPNGSASAPTYSFSGGATTGAYSNGAGSYDISISGTRRYAFDASTLAILSDTAQIQMGVALDCNLSRDAAAVLALKNGTTAQEFRVYNTFTDASNYERGALIWSSNVFRIDSSAAGTGTARNLRLAIGGSGWTLVASSLQIQPDGDNDRDLGTSSLRVRTGYFGTAITLGTNPAASGALRIAHGSYVRSRNSANTADLDLIVASSDRIEVGSSTTPVLVQPSSAGHIGFFSTTPITARTGWGTATGTATRTTFDTTTVTLSGLAERVKALIDDLHQTAGYGLLRT
jgi:hypothetical protein